MIIAALSIFQAWIWVGVSIAKCQTSIQIRHIARLFEFWCEYTPKRGLWNLICVTSKFFAFTVYFSSNPLSEFCYIHLTFTAVGRHHEVFQELL